MVLVVVTRLECDTDSLLLGSDLALIGNDFGGGSMVCKASDMVMVLPFYVVKGFLQFLTCLDEVDYSLLIWNTWLGFSLSAPKCALCGVVSLIVYVSLP